MLSDRKSESQLSCNLNISLNMSLNMKGSHEGVLKATRERYCKNHRVKAHVRHIKINNKHFLDRIL